MSPPSVCVCVEPRSYPVFSPADTCSRLPRLHLSVSPARLPLTLLVSREAAVAVGADVRHARPVVSYDANDAKVII